MPLNKWGKKISSQNGEAGIIEHIFNVIGHGGKQLLEIGFSWECNSANLLSNHGWSGWLIDGDKNQIEKCLNRWSNAKLIHAFVIVDTQFFGVPKELDFLSIDIDGNDYWIWESMDIKANLVCIEYNASLGWVESLTIPYDPSFNRYNYHNTTYHGASLVALTHLAEKKDMALIGCEDTGVNAFFLKKDLLTDDLIEISPKEAYYPLRSRKPWQQALRELKRDYKLESIK